MSPGRRFVAVANGVALAVGLWFAVRSGTTGLLGPAQSDDLPYGNLLTLSRPGALLWSVLAIAGLLAALTGRLPVAIVTGAAWAALSLTAFVVVVTDTDFLGLARPGGAAAALALALATGLGLLTPAADTPRMSPRA